MTLIETYQQEQIAHSIDHIGQKYGLKRFKEESTQEFRDRVLDTFLHKSNPSLFGQIATASRHLGCPIKRWCSIRKKKDSGSGEYINKNAGLIVTNISIQFYNDISVDEISEEFFVVKREDKYLNTWWYGVDFINYIEDSTDWEFDIEPLDTTRYKLLQFLVPSNSFVRGQSFPGFTGMTYLPKELDYIPSTLTSSSKYLTNKVESFEEVIEEGDYFFDEVSSILYTKETGRRETFNFSIDCSVKEMFIEIAPVSYKPICDTKLRYLFTERVIGLDNLSIEGFYLVNDWLFYVIESMKLDKTLWIGEDANRSSVDVYGKSSTSSILLDEVSEKYFSKANENFRNLLSTYGNR